MVMVVSVLVPFACGKARFDKSDQAVLSGQVLDEARRTPVAGAKVRILDRSNLEAAPVAELETDGEGRFAVPELRPGSYRIEVEAGAYIKAERDVELEKMGGETGGLEVLIYLSVRGDTHPAWTSYLPHGTIHAISGSENGDLWFGTDGGLIRMSPGGTQVVYSASEGLPATRVLSVARIEGSVWVGTENGLARLRDEGAAWEVFQKNEEGLAGNKVFTIRQGPDRTLWLGTDGGVSHLDGFYWVNFKKGSGDVTQNCAASALPHPSVLSLDFDPDGKIWFGTGEGLASFGLNTWCWYIENWPNVGLQDNRINQIQVLPGSVPERSVKWLATGEGISSFDGCRWSTWSTAVTSAERPPVKESKCSVGGQDCSVGNVNWVCTVDGSSCSGDPTACSVKGGECKGTCALPGASCEVGRAECEAAAAECTLPPRGCSADGSMCSDEAACVAKGGACFTSKLRCQSKFFNCVLPTLTCPGDPACASAEASCESSDLACLLPQRACSFTSNVCEGDTSCSLPSRECSFPRERPCPITTRSIPKDGIPDDVVLSLRADDASHIWAGTRRGLGKMENQVWSIVKDIPAEPVHALYKEGSTIWAGTQTQLWRFDGSVWSKQDLASGPRGGDTRDILLLGEDVWVATDKGVSTLKSDGTWKHFGVEEGLPSTDVRALAAASQGVAWAGTAKGLALMGADGTWKSSCQSEKDALDTCTKTCDEKESKEGCSAKCAKEREAWTACEDPFGDIRALASDGGDGLWMGTSRGLFKVTGKTPEKRRGLSGNLVTALLLDTDGALWVATAPGGDTECQCFREGGLNRVEGESVVSFQPPDAPAGRVVTAIVRDGQGRLWTASESDLSVYDRGAWSHYSANASKPESGPADKIVNAIGFLADGEAWVGTKKGVSKTLDPAGSWQHLTTEDGLADNHVKVIRVRSGQEVWIGTKNGVSVFRRTAGSE